MIAFHVRLAVRSLRWLGPAIVVLLWASFTAASPGAALSNAGSESFMLIAIACWLTVAIGNLDDDGHRELLAAAAGSPGSLHRARALAALALANLLALVPTLTGLIAGRPDGNVHAVVVVLTCGLVQLAATALGVAIGTFGHRPVVRNGGGALLACIAALVALALLPPVQHVLRDLNDDRVGSALVATAIALLLAVGAIGVAGELANRAH